MGYSEPDEDDPTHNAFEQWKRWHFWTAITALCFILIWWLSDYI
jgi:hypothetical protein